MLLSGLAFPDGPYQTQFDRVVGVVGGVLRQRTDAQQGTGFVHEAEGRRADREARVERTPPRRRAAGADAAGLGCVEREGGERSERVFRREAGQLQPFIPLGDRALGAVEKIGRGDCTVHQVRADRGAAEGGQCASCAEEFAPVVAEAAHVGAGGAGHGKRDGPGDEVDVFDRELRDVHLPHGRLDFFSPAHPFVEAHAVDLDRRHRGGLLVDRAEEALRRFAHCRFVDRGVARLHDIPRRVVAVRGDAEGEHGGVGLLAGGEEREEPRGAAPGQQQEPGRERIERTGVADAPRADDLAQAVDRVVRRDARLLVEADDRDVAEVAQAPSSPSSNASPSLIRRRMSSMRAPRSIDSS